MARKKLKLAKETPLTEEEKIHSLAQQIGQILQNNGMGMQPVIQIFKLPPQKSPIQPQQPKTVEQMARDAGIVVSGGEGDLPPAVVEMLKPIGDEIENK